MTGKERADAARNRQAILDAADRLFADSADPHRVSMDDIAAAAGVGKGTLFRRFGDRTGLIREVYAARLAPLRDRIENGPPPLGPSGAPRERIAAIIDAIAVFKLENAHLMTALEDGGAPAHRLHESADYAAVHELLTDLITDLISASGGPGHAGWVAHMLLAAVRADLLRHLADVEKRGHAEIRANLRAFTAHLLSLRPPDGAGRIP
ncbi:MAG TPA: helix-turn-helix domain-containing protein [Spirillospora sp.]